jgi:hypothetical protein
MNVEAVQAKDKKLDVPFTKEKGGESHSSSKGTAAEHGG